MGNVGTEAEIDKAGKENISTYITTQTQGGFSPKRKKKTSPPSRLTHFQGFSQRQHGAKTILKTIDAENRCGEFFRETSHWPKQGWQCVCSAVCSCFLPLLFVLSECLTVQDQSPECLEGCQATPLSSGHSGGSTAGPPNYE